MSYASRASSGEFSGADDAPVTYQLTSQELIGIDVRGAWEVPVPRLGDPSPTGRAPG